MLAQFRHLLLAAVLGGLFAAIAVVASAHFLASSPQPAEPQSWSESHLNRQSEAVFARGAAGMPESFRLAAKKSMAAVVHISTREQQALSLWDFYYGRQAQVREGSGSGVIYSSSGYIVTNNHVIESADAIEVSLSDNRRYTAQLVGRYPAADIAVLKIVANDLPNIRFGDSDLTEVGDWVLAVGNPYNLSSTVTAGIVSARGRDIGIINDRNAIESFIQTDAAINPGNSGGALVNTSGELIGINTAIYSRSGGYSGYGFAIPANLAVRIIEDLISTGTYQQIVLGIDAGELDTEWAQELGVPVIQGVVLQAVAPNGAADVAGLIAGDVVVEVSGRSIRSIAQFREALGSQKRGQKVPLAIYRGASKRVVELQL